MQVSVRVALHGGHSWEFSCDEGDPRVMGLVSALPGATVDPSLSPDGLIQIEAQPGERMFVTRSSLVAVTVTPITRIASATHATSDTLLKGRSGSIAPTPFVLIPACLPPDALRDLGTAISRVSLPTDHAAEIDLPFLPDSVSAALVTALSEARSTLLAGDDDDTHLDVRLHLAHGASLPLPDGAPGDKLRFAILIPLQDEPALTAAVDLHDQLSAGAATPVESSRTLVLHPNTALVIPAAAGCDRLQFARSAPSVVLSGSLRNGAAHGG